jgi:hypothetical protein
MLIAPDVNEPGYWHRRAKEARRMADRMIDETAKQTLLSVAEDCDRFAVKAAMRSLDELTVRRFISETKGS